MKKIIALLLLISMLFTCSLGANLSDIDNHWAILNIMKATNVGFFNGYPDGTFKPNNTITRLEFITIMTKLLENVVEIDIDSYKNIFKYEDLDENSWGTPFFNKLMYYSHVFSDETADDVKGKTLAKKIFGDSLEPNKPITREEAVGLMSAFLDESKLSGENLILTDIFDSLYIDDIQKFCKTGIIKGYPDGTFKPKNNITRAEASVIIVELFNNKSLIKEVKWKNKSPYLDYNVVRNEPEDVVLQVLLCENMGQYSEAHQYLSYMYKENNGIMNSNYYPKNKESHILPQNFIFDEDKLEISIKKEKKDKIEIEFKNTEFKEKYTLELVLVGVEDWYINSKNY